MSTTPRDRRPLLAAALALLASLCVLPWAVAGAGKPAASALEFLGGGAAGGPAAVQAGERRSEVGRLAAAGDWEGAARVCHDWLFDDPAAAWPNAALALIHERCGSLPLAKYYAGRALELSFAGGGHPDATIVGLNRRIRDAWLRAAPPAAPPPLFCRPAAP